MIKDDTRQTLKFLAWLLIAIVVLYLATLAVFYKASNPVRSETRSLNNIAVQKTPIKHITKNYHLDRGVNSYALAGQAKDHTRYYFVYLPGSKRGHLFLASQGVSETQVRRQFTAKSPDRQVVKVNLGWYKKGPVWEVASKDVVGNFYYQLYDFKNGKSI